MAKTMRQYAVEDIGALSSSARLGDISDDLSELDFNKYLFGRIAYSDELSEQEKESNKREFVIQMMARAMMKTADIAEKIEPFQKRIERVVEMLTKDNLISEAGKNINIAVIRGVDMEGGYKTTPFPYLISKIECSERLGKRMAAAKMEPIHYVKAVWLTVVSEEDDIPDGREYNFRRFFYPAEDNLKRIACVQHTAVLLAILDDYTKLVERPTKGKAAEARAIKNGEEALEKQRKTYEHKIETLMKEQEAKRRAALRDASEKAEKQKNELNRLIKNQDRELYELRKENEMMRAQLELMNWPGVLATARDMANLDTQNEHEEQEEIEPATEAEFEESLPELPSKNVVFVGGAPNTQKKLRQIFPDWDFVGSEGVTSSYTMSTKPDVIFLWTGYMAHGMLQSVEARIEAPRVYLKRTNIDAMIEEMRSGYKKVLEGQNIVS